MKALENWRIRAWPGTDQQEVLRRQYPALSAAITSAKEQP